MSMTAQRRRPHRALLASASLLAALAAGAALAQSPPAAPSALPAATAPEAAAAPPVADPAIDTDLLTGSTALPAGKAGEDGFAALDNPRLNLRENTVDGLRRLRRLSNETPGIRIGTFVFRPSLTQSLARETAKSAGTSTSRSYLQTGLKGTLTSDWSLHQLIVTGEATRQRRLSGEGEDEPGTTLDAALRLDLPHDSTLNLAAGYQSAREDASDPNAVAGASAQAEVTTLTAGISAAREEGILRGLIGLDLKRLTYGSARLADGSSLSLADRDRTAGTLRLRVGYALSPALVPFVEGSLGRSVTDAALDGAGYDRDFREYGLKGGIAFDFGEKLRGEIGLGHRSADFADARLGSISALAAEGLIDWSPRRGTAVTLGLSSLVEPSTAAGQSGYAGQTLSLGLAEELRENLVARLSGAATWRDYEGVDLRETVWRTGAGLTYRINPFLDLTGDLAYERVVPDAGTASSTLNAGLGLTLKR